MDHFRARCQADPVAMTEADFTVDAHGDGLCQTGLVDMEEGVRAEVFGNADHTRPFAAGFQNRYVLGSDTDRVGILARRNVTGD